ncbi:MAG: family N-acetyltransferase [Bacteroidota bacterium]|nr:family N-acetyltransferase [Bacteroidota bacterium]
MIIRKATIDDISQLSLLFDAYRVFYKMESNVDGAALFLSDRIQNLESIVYVSLDEENNLTGFVQLYPIFSSTRLKRFWLLNDLYVKPELRRSGISIALIDAAKELCRNSGSCGMMLETAKSNIVGNNLYPKTGFKLDNDHNFYSWGV